MNCNCNCFDSNNSVIQFIKGTTADITFDFDEDISSYTKAVFVIRKDYDTAPVINKEISSFDANSIDVVLTPTETGNFNEFQNGKTSAHYIWGLDLLDEVNDIQINVFPQTGNPAPLCIVYKHVV